MTLEATRATVLGQGQQPQQPRRGGVRRWESSAYLIYVRPTPRDLRGMGRRMVEAPDESERRDDER